MERIELMPGIRLNHVQTDRFKTGCFSLNMLQPLTEADAAPNALIPSVLLRGCRSCPDLTAISARLDLLYGASLGSLVRKRGEIQSIGMSTGFLEDRYTGEPLFAKQMEFLREVLLEPCMENDGFVEAFTAGEKQNLSNAIAASINDKRSYAMSRLRKHMFPGQAFSVPRIGEAYTLESVNGRNLWQRYDRLLRTSPMELFYLGQQSAETVSDTLKELLSALPAGQRVPAVTDTSREPHPVRYVEEALDVTQGKLAIGLRTDITARDARHPAMILMNTVFGGGMNSKLFLQIREAQSLCYYAGSSIEMQKGVMTVDCGIEFEKYQQALDGILQQLELCRKGEISKDELEEARTYMISSCRSALDSPSSMDDFALGQACIGLSGTIEQRIADLEKVTMDQVVEAANTLVLDTVYFLKGVEK